MGLKTEKAADDTAICARRNRSTTSVPACSNHPAAIQAQFL
jgi:hypothetical protein